MGASVLVVSGGSDWVVPPGPEAIEPMARTIRSSSQGHRLVLVEAADHFNLRSSRPDGGGPLRGLILAWFNAAAQGTPGTALQLPGGGWGSTTHPLRDVTPALSQVAVPGLGQP
jgi:hypothetical protein